MNVICSEKGLTRHGDYRLIRWVTKRGYQIMWVRMNYYFWIFGQAGVALVVLKNHILSGYIRNIKIEGLAFWGFH